MGFTRLCTGCCCVHPRWFCSLGLAPGGRSVHPGSLGSLGGALVVVGFIRSRWVHPGSHWVSFSPSGVIGFILVRPGRRCVHLGSLVSLWFALGVVGFIRSRWIDSGSPWVSSGSLVIVLGVVGFIRGGWVHSGVPFGSLDSLVCA